MLACDLSLGTVAVTATTVRCNGTAVIEGAVLPL
jgi:hypothetical protein